MLNHPIIVVGAISLSVAGTALGQGSPSQLIALPTNTSGGSDCTTMRAVPASGELLVLVPLVMADPGGVTDAGSLSIITFGAGGSVVRQQELKSPSPVASESFGEGAASDGTTLVAVTRSTGAIHFFERRNGLFEHVQAIAGSLTPLPFVFPCWISGDRAVVGDPGAANESGRFLVLAKSSGTWSVTRAISPPSPVARRHFGGSLDATPSRIIAAENTNPPAGCTGRAFVYDAANLDAPPQQLPGPTGTSGCGLFGTGIAGIDDVIAVTARDDSANGSTSGSVVVYERAGSAWSQVLRSGPSISAGNAEWGYSSVSAGRVLSWGYPGSYSRVPVSVFSRSGTSWGLERTIAVPASETGGFRGGVIFMDTAFISILNGTTAKLAVYPFIDCDGDGLGDRSAVAAGLAADYDGDGVPNACDPPTCESADLYANGQVNGADLAIVLSEWGAVTPTTTSDITGDGRVDGQDLAFILSFWGPCAP
jgi:hypothetical protein